MSEATRCTALTVAGRQCSGVRNLQNGLCQFHDPLRAAEMKAMRQRGQIKAVEARARKKRERLALLSETAGERPPVGDTLESIAVWLRWLAEAGVRGQVDRFNLVALTNTARVLQGVYDKRDLQRRIKALEGLIATLKKAKAP